MSHVIANCVGERIYITEKGSDRAVEGDVVHVLLHAATDAADRPPFVYEVIVDVRRLVRLPGYRKRQGWVRGKAEELGVAPFFVGALPA